MKVWLTYSGRYFGDGYVQDVAYTTKKTAETKARDEGFRWDADQKLFLNDDEERWRRIESIDVVKEL